MLRPASCRASMIVTLTCLQTRITEQRASTIAPQIVEIIRIQHGETSSAKFTSGSTKKTFRLKFIATVQNVGTWMQQQCGHAERAIFTFLTVDVCRARWPDSGHASVTRAKVARWRHWRIRYLSCLNVVLPNYRVKYHDYIVKWCSGMACDWCVSMDISLTLVKGIVQV